MALRVDMDARRGADVQSQIVPIQEPVPLRLPPRVGSTPVPGTDAARGGPRCCAKCGAGGVRPKYHRDIIACLLDQPVGSTCGGEHLHWRCGNCGADFTTPLLPGTHSD